MTEQWKELKETIIELRDNNGVCTQQEVCKFLVNLMDVLEKQMQQPCEDCISRQAAIDTIESWLSCDDYNKGERNIMRVAQSVLYDLPPVTPKPCEDCISREEALKHSHIEYDEDGEGHRVVYVEDIDDLPSVTPRQIKGQWLEVIDDTDSSGRKKNWHYKCSICGNEDSGWGEYNYCPICGAEMKEV